MAVWQDTWVALGGEIEASRDAAVAAFMAAPVGSAIGASAAVSPVLSRTQVASSGVPLTGADKTLLLKVVWAGIAKALLKHTGPVSPDDSVIIGTRADSDGVLQLSLKAVSVAWEKINYAPTGPDGAVLGANLLSNPSAESNNYGVAGGDYAPRITGWTRSSADATPATAGHVAVGPRAISYADGGYPWHDTFDQPPSAGDYYFYGGTHDPSASITTLTQTLDLSADATAIDTGVCAYDMSGWFAWFMGDPGGGLIDELEYAHMRVYFEGSGHAALTSSAEIGGRLGDAGSYAAPFRQDSTTGTVPIGARYARVVLSFNFVLGSDSNSAADNLAFRLGGLSAVGLDRPLYTIVWQTDSGTPALPVALWVKTGVADTDWSLLWRVPGFETLTTASGLLILGAKSKAKVAGTEDVLGMSMGSLGEGDEFLLQSTSARTFKHAGSPGSGFAPFALEGGQDITVTSRSLLQFVLILESGSFVWRLLKGTFA